MDSDEEPGLVDSDDEDSSFIEYVDRMKESRRDLACTCGRPWSARPGHVPLL